ncbi:glycoside hydrolase family 99-like domain-containing protein [Pontibacter sp. H259]|uniref:glycosyltransferase WbsX family protein n=1 Tax=Pontibacter sp. H259 TaxID=3133421 RepID=UPI0030BE2CFC
MIKPKVLAFYLPQYHPIPENNKWWGNGFTEWTNVTKAKPLFKGHQQPKFPADFGYYDLRLPEVREEQAVIAKRFGVDGFVYYHYWFGNGKQLLERPFNEVLESGKPDFPFCLCWANQTWSGVWHGAPNKTLIKQEYPGSKDNELHFEYLFKAFADPRYIRINDKPLFMVYDLNDLPDPKKFAIEIKEAAIGAGFKGVYLMASNLNYDSFDLKGNEFDGKVSHAFNRVFSELRNRNGLIDKLPSRIKRLLPEQDEQKKLSVIDHQLLVNETSFVKSNVDTYPMVVPNWDNTPRSSTRGVVLTNSSPELFRKQILKSIDFLEKNPLAEPLIFIKSWNEWAEGNYIEPDTVFGYKYLQVIKDTILHKKAETKAKIL